VNWDYRYVNDEGDRIPSMIERGWEIDTSRNNAVKPKDNAGMGAETSAYAGTKENGGALKAVLMRIPKEIADEDRLAKRNRIDERMTSIQRGRVAEADAVDQAAFDAHPMTGSKLKFG
jgi:hypothetical protein